MGDTKASTRPFTPCNNLPQLPVYSDLLLLVSSIPSLIAWIKSPNSFKILFKVTCIFRKASAKSPISSFWWTSTTLSILPFEKSSARLVILLRGFVMARTVKKIKVHTSAIDAPPMIE